jgi:hypothetical protein
MQQFAEGTYIEMRDRNGARYIGQVTEAGDEYVCTGCSRPQKILDSEPLVIGDHWSFRQRMRVERPADFCEFEAFVQEVCRQDGLSELDVTTLAHWAFHGGEFFGRPGVAQGLAALATCQTQAVIRQEQEHSVLAA